MFRLLPSAGLVLLLLASALPGRLTAAAIAAGKPKWLGSAYSNPQATNFATYFNQIVPENGGKWGSVEGTRDVMNWGEADAAYNLAKTNGWPFRFHILVWGNQQPAWIESLSTAEQREEIEEWFAAVAARYPDADYIEVVNEPLHDPPNMAGNGGGNYINALGGSGVTGWDWILEAFRIARPLFPNSKLVLNEYSVVNDGNQMARYVEIINLLKAENLVDVVAEQAHAFTINTVSETTLTNNLNTLAATGLPIMITEMDIDGLDSTTVDETTQLARYQRVFPILWEHPSVIGITLWGWRPGLWRANAVLQLSNGTDRSAFTWMQNYVAASDPPLLVQITAGPADVDTTVGEDVAFSVSATGNPAPAIQWQRSTDDGANWSDVSNDATFGGATTATLAITGATTALSGDQFRAVLTNGTNGSPTTAAATLTVNKAAATVALSSLVQDFSGSPLSPSATTTPAGLTVDLTFDGSATMPTAAGSYAVVATINDASYAGTASGTFEIRPTVALDGGGAPITTTAGDAPTMSVTAAGGTATYQWQFQPSGGGAFTNIAGATDSEYTIPSAQVFLSGNYRVQVTVNGATTNSGSIAVTVNAAAPSAARLVNLSTRGLSLTGDQVLIPGFVVGGTGTKRLLIRAVGPTLANDPFFVSGTLPDPRMILRRLDFSVSPPVYIDVDANDNWVDAPNAAAITQAISDLSAFAFQSDAEAALLVDLGPGQYTVVADGAAGETGVAIVELYDADPAGSGARLFNISNRGFAGVGDEVMIPGVVISSEGPKTLLVRVVGPTLADPPYNVGGTMADPKLSVFSGSTEILTNDNWEDNPDAANTATVAANLSAFPLASGSADAAFVVTLQPGLYTIIGSAANGTDTGVILVEIYVVQ